MWVFPIKVWSWQCCVYLWSYIFFCFHFLKEDCRLVPPTAKVSYFLFPFCSDMRWCTKHWRKHWLDSQPITALSALTLIIHLQWQVLLVPLSTLGLYLVSWFLLHVLPWKLYSQRDLYPSLLLSSPGGAGIQSTSRKTGSSRYHSWHESELNYQHDLFTAKETYFSWCHYQQAQRLTFLYLVLSQPDLKTSVS